MHGDSSSFFSILLATFFLISCLLIWRPAWAGGSTAVQTAETAVQPTSLMQTMEKPIIKTLKAIHAHTGNYGWAIVLLTGFMRLILLPLNIWAKRSQAKFKALDPKIKDIQRLHKNDPKRMQKEIMALMKEEGINPLTSFLPILPQLPIFLALTQGISHAAELKKSPFVAWLKDLSIPDPLYILPVLLALLTFAQQKFLGSSVPASQGLTFVIPAVISFSMMALPSGVVLYYVANAIFGFGEEVLWRRWSRA